MKTTLARDWGNKQKKEKGVKKEEEEKEEVVGRHGILIPRFAAGRRHQPLWRRGGRIIV